MEPIGTFSKGYLGPNHVQANCLRELEVYLQLQFEFFQINFWKLSSNIVLHNGGHSRLIRDVTAFRLKESFGNTLHCASMSILHNG